MAKKYPVRLDGEIRDLEGNPAVIREGDRGPATVRQIIVRALQATSGGNRQEIERGMELAQEILEHPGDVYEFRKDDYNWVKGIVERVNYPRFWLYPVIQAFEAAEKAAEKQEKQREK